MSTQRKLRRINWWNKQKRKNSEADVIKGQTGKPDNDVTSVQQTISCRGFRSISKRADTVTNDVVNPVNTRKKDHMQHISTNPVVSDTSSSEQDEIISDDETKHDPPSKVTSTVSKQKRRYILFLGNLSIDATVEDILTHFKKKGVVIKELRLLTYKDTGKSRGCGFAEFADDRSMKNALKFHRSKLKGKCVNIEVTCGGGGKGDQRKTKIETKNRRQRIARAKKCKKLGTHS